MHAFVFLYKKFRGIIQTWPYIRRAREDSPTPRPRSHVESGFSAARGTCAGNVVGPDDANIHASF
jgi:hypothetical protein